MVRLLRVPDTIRTDYGYIFFWTYGFLHTLVSHGIPLPVCGHEDALSPAGFLALQGLQLHVALHERYVGGSADTGCGEAGAAAGCFCRGITGLWLSAASLLSLHRRHRAWNMSVSFGVGKGRAARETETWQWDKVAQGWSVMKWCRVGTTRALLWHCCAKTKENNRLVPRVAWCRYARKPA